MALGDLVSLMWKLKNWETLDLYLISLLSHLLYFDASWQRKLEFYLNTSETQGRMCCLTDKDSWGVKYHDEHTKISVENLRGLHVKNRDQAEIDWDT